MWKDDWREELNMLRGQIDNLDSEIIGLVSRRMKICEKVGEIKAQHDLPVYVPEREKQVIGTREQWGKSFGLKAKFIRILFRLIMVQSRMLQRELVNV